jgi:hypothetical protein
MNAVQEVTFEKDTKGVNRYNDDILDASNPKYKEIFSHGMVDVGEFILFTRDVVSKIENENISIR